VLGEPLENLTFWNRKAAALDVAEGDVREILSRLRALQSVYNKDWNAAAEAARQQAVDASVATPPSCLKRLRTTVVGHSFGGLAVYEALSSSLVRDIAELDERIRAGDGVPPADAKDQAGKPIPPRDPLVSREGDVVITINAAMEASRYEVLDRVSRALTPHNYHSPIFVGVTTVDDSATRRWFPIGRWLDTLTTRYPTDDGRERNADLETYGHDRAYVTYDLNLFSVANANARNGLQPDSGCAEEKDMPAGERGEFEKKRVQAFVDSLGPNLDASTLPAPYTRRYCISPEARAVDKGADVEMVLAPVDDAQTYRRNNPVWNIQTRKPILNEHSDLMNLRMMDFLRQLYAESNDPRAIGLQAERPAVAANAPADDVPPGAP
jgi:hypothetical protein